MEAGEEIVIARRGVPIARLSPVRRTFRARKFGVLKGIVRVGPEFFEPMADDELAQWES